MVVYLVVCLFSFFVVYLLIPLTKHLITYYGIVDQPGKRKIHQSPVPLSGGLAIFIGTIGTLFLFFEPSRLHFALTWGGLALLVTGIADDYYKSKGKDFPAWPKLLIQVLTAVFTYFLGIQFVGISNLFAGEGQIFFPEWLSLVTTILWIVGLINMINFLDGMDGLASGITVISSLTLFFIAIIKLQYDVAVLAVVIIGASLAFLRHNFHPASVFLGDSGSMFLGYFIGITSLYGTMKSATLITLLITILALGVPVLDTVQVIISRLKEGTPIYKPDKRHVHHRLLSAGMTQTQAVMVIYAIGIGFSLLSLVLLFFIG